MDDYTRMPDDRPERNFSIWFTLSLATNTILAFAVIIMAIKMTEMAKVTGEALDMAIRIAAYNYFGNG